MSRSVAVFAMVLFSLSCSAGQPGAGGTVIQRTGGPTDAEDQSMLEKLIQQLGSKKNVVAPNAIMAVKPSEASICEVCNQPRYRHLEADFICLPLGPDGKPLHLKSVKIVDKVPCPVCKSNFEAAMPGNVNDKGGLDRDLCAHSIGKHVVHSNLWVCPECGYSALIPRPPDGKDEAIRVADFQLGLDGKPLDEETKTFVRQKLSEPMRNMMIRQAGLKEDNLKPDLLRFASYIPQTQIADWIKYENGLQIYERQKKAPHALMARLYLEAAHACRREICSEISAPYLEKDLQESLGKAIARMNRYLQSTCQGVRMRRNEPIIDPTRMETDPKIVALASLAIIRAAREKGAQTQDDENDPKARQHWFSNADMFIMHLNYAGALDRLGKIEDAGTVLSQALAFVPERLGTPLENKDMEERIKQQLKLLRGIVIERQVLLNREQEWLFKAARHNLAAIKFNEVKFRDPLKGTKQDEASGRLCDPAPTSYLLGELFRRSNDANYSTHWFVAANRIIEKGLAKIDAEEAAMPAAVPVIHLQGGTRRPPTLQALERQRLNVLKYWTQDQLSSLKVMPKPLDAADRAVIEQVLTATGLAPQILEEDLKTILELNQQATSAQAKKTAPPEQPKNAGPKAASEAVVAAGAIKTRADLYKLYYDAMMKFRGVNEKKNPETLSDLVKSGYIRAEDSNLDEKGKLICPESGDRIGYMRQWDPADKTKPILYCIKAGSKSFLCLFPEMEIKEWTPGKEGK